MDLLYKDPTYRKSIYSDIPPLDVSSLMNLLDPGQQYELYTLLEKKFSPLNSMKQRINSLEEKYFDIVWLSRREPKDYLRPNISKIATEIMDKYSEDLVTNHWTSGFSCGMLACTRLLKAYTLPLNHQDVISEKENIIIYRDDEIKEVEEDFPFLDT